MLKFCDSPFTTISIHSNGNVDMCLCSVWHTQKPIGTLKKNSLSEVFNSDLANEFRNSVYDQSFRFCNRLHCGKVWNLDEVPNFDHVDKAPRLPTVVMLKLDRSCNLKCASCRNGLFLSPEVDNEVEQILNKFIEEYQDYDKPVTIHLDGIGDIFVSELYQKFLRNPNLPKCFNFLINTNGNLLTKNLDLLTKLKDQIKSITVSLDAATPKTYKEVRGGNFNIVLEGIKQVTNLGIVVTTQFVLQSKNYTEIVQYRDLCQQLNVQHIGLKKIRRWSHQTDSWWAENSIDNNPEVNTSLLLSLLQEFKSTSLPTVEIDGDIENLLRSSSTLVQKSSELPR